MKALGQLWGSCLVALVGACSSSTADQRPPGLWVTYRNERIVYHVRPNDPVNCAGYFTQLTDETAMLSRYLGLEPSPDKALEFYQFTDAEWNGQHYCNNAAANGCNTLDGLVWGIAATFEHELVHEMASRVGTPPPYFQEGLAKAVTCSDLSLQWMITSPKDTWQTYFEQGAEGAYADLFVTFLLNSYGPTAFLQLYAALPLDASSVDVAKAFEDVYATPIDAVWSAMTQGGPTGLRQCVPVLQCAAPVLTATATTLGRACDGATARRLPTETMRLNMSGASTRLVTCEPSEPSVYNFYFPAGTTSFDPKGSSYALFQSGMNGSAVASASVPELELSVSCDKTETTYPVPGYQRTFLFGWTTHYIDVQADGTAPLYFGFSTGNAASWSIETCTGCTDGKGSNCESTEVWPLARQGRFWIKLAPIDEASDSTAVFGVTLRALAS